MLKRILIPIGIVIALGALIAAKPNGIDNTVDLLETASNLYSSDQAIKIPPLRYVGGEGLVQFRVPSNSEAGVRYEHTMTEGLYRLEIYSPEGLPDLAYSPYYVWQNWVNKPPTWHR